EGVQADPVTGRADALDGPAPFLRVEVVEDALAHQEEGRDGPLLLFDARELDGRRQREVHVVAQEQVSGQRLVVEEDEAVAALPRRLEQHAVVHDVEGAAHETSTSSSDAAASARSTASRFVSPSATIKPRRSPSTCTGRLVSPGWR